MRKFVAAILLLLCVRLQAGEEIGYIETFALADDRAEALKELVPGTDDYYYFHCLHYQNTGQADLYRQYLETWIRRHNGSVIPQARELMNRQALLDYERDPKATLDYIRHELDMRFDHKRRTGEQESSAPTSFDNNLISIDTLLAYALSDRDSLRRIEDAGLELVAARDITPEQRRNLLSRLERPDYPGIVDQVVADLRYKQSRGFGHHPIHAKLLLGQLDELLRKEPSVRNQDRFVDTYLAKLAPIDEVDLDLDVAAREAYLNRVWSFARTLDPAHNSLKANVLYNRLRHDRDTGVHDKARFMEYIKLPRNVPYLKEEVRRNLPSGAHMAELNRDFGLIALPPVGDEEPLVRSFLERFMKDAPDYAEFQPWLREAFLKRVFASAKIANGVGDPEKWASMLSAAEYKEIKERVEIDFAPDNPKSFGVDDAVRLSVYVKNVPSLIVKVFEINTFNYYRETGRPLNLAVDLDGLVASHEERFEYKEAPELRVLRAFDLAMLSRRGVYVVELIGNGRSSRALVRKGRLGLLQDVTSAGHVFVVLDENNRRLPDATIWMQGREYAAEDDGRIIIPFSTQPRTETLIVKHGDFADLTRFEHQAEQYRLRAGIYVDREALLRREKTQFILRPVLLVGGRPTSLKLLEDVRLVIRSVNHLGIASEKEIADFALHEDRDSIYEFKIPEELTSLEFRLRARVRNISRNQKEDLEDGAVFALNRIDKSDAVQDLHVSRTADGYILEARGKKGEPRPKQGLQLWFKHRFFSEEVHASLRTDDEGRCRLGALDGVERFRVRGPDGTEHTWHVKDHAYSFPDEIHGTAGETLRLPLVHAKPDDLSLVSLLDRKQGRFVNDWRDALSVDGGFLELKDLPAGDYSLYLKPDRQSIAVKLTEGEERDGFALSEKRALQKKRLAPVHLAGVEVTAAAVKLKIANATPFTRVHVFATRYLPAYDVFAELGYTGQPGLLEQSWTRTPTFYESGRKIGDEYRYILDRKSAKKYPGNMLERPGLLLNPWAIRDAGAGAEELEGGGTYADRAAREARAAMATSVAAKPTAAGEDAYANLDFLSEPAVTLVNLRPDRNGVIEIAREDLRGKPQLRIMVEDPESSVFKEIALDDSPVKTRELRLADGLDPEKTFAEQKIVSVVEKGATFAIGDVTTSSFETYDTLAKAYRLLGTLNADPTFNEFGFILRWPGMKDEERRELYSKYACHELNFFLYHKDPGFFKDVVKPYLANKKDKTFMDLWLLDGDLSGYLEPWKYARLNTVERILLGRHVRAQFDSVERDIRELNDLIPPDVEGFNRRFDTAVQIGALEGEGKRAQMLKDAREASELRARGALGKLGFEGMPAPEPAAPAAPPPAAEDAPDRASGIGGLRLAARGDGDELKMEVTDRAFYYDYDDDGRRREKLRRLFQKLDKTKEWAENNYYQLPIEQQQADLVQVSDFWAEYAAHDGKAPFTSRRFAQAARSFTEMMLALAVLDLPFEAGKHEESVEGVTFKLKAEGPMVVFHKEILEAQKGDDASPVLVTQHFFRADDRYRHENNERFEKYVTREFLTHVVYGCRVILTNPSANRRKLNLLLQIPLGAMPVNNGFYTRGVYQVVEPYNTRTVEYYFYFPETGRYPHYPVTAAENEQVIAAEEAFVFNVVPELSEIDKTSWAWISQNGTPEQVVEYLNDCNIHRTDLGEIAWRMRDGAYFRKITDLVASRHAYHQALWSYGILHNDPGTAREFLRHSPFADRCGLSLASPLLALDPVERLAYQHLEYLPLVNARSHRVGAKRKILNHLMREQYERLMKVLSYKAALNDTDELGVTYYLALQDRVEEALEWFDRVDRGKVPEGLQYDYMQAYLGLYRKDLATAEKLASKYADHPVDKWRERFVNLKNQLDELTQGAAEAADTESRDQTQAQLAATEPALDLRVEAQKIRIDYRNLDTCILNLYPMDIELLFSRNPFLQQDSAQFSFIRPVWTRRLDLPPGGETLESDIPEAFSARNVMIEALGAGLRRSRAYYANTLRVDVTENYGQLRVTHAGTREALSAVYVKAYARMRDGSVRFFKDGYTDFRGRFDYVSLNTNELDDTERLAVLVLSEDYGAVVREVAPPKR